MHELKTSVIFVGSLAFDPIHKRFFSLVAVVTLILIRFT